MDGQAGYYDGREKREENAGYQQQQQQQQSQQQPQQHQHQSQQSPPHSASPFAFAPPPLSSSGGQSQTQRPGPPPHQPQSEPLPSVQYQPSYYNQRPAQPVHAASFPASTPMGAYRSYSNDSAAAGRASPQPPNAPMSRTTSMNYPPQSQAAQPPHPHSAAYNSYRSPPASYASPSTRPSPYAHPSYYNHPQHYPSVAAPSSVDMPRSASYPHYNHNQSSYPSYMPGHQPGYPSYHGHPASLPPLQRHASSTSTIGEGMGGMDLNRSTMSYAFAHRLPLVDRPFKCDECVQSFNRNHDLKRHKRIHLAVKPFGCDKCGKTFSRKDALRRHWLVKGCRGEDGATAPIMPLFPINAQAPALSPPSPPGNSSPTEPTSGHPFPAGGLSFSHPSAPPPLSTLPPRQQTESTTSLLITPNDVQPASAPAIISLDEAHSIMPTGMAQRTSQSSTGSYFETAQSQHMADSVMMEKSRSSGSHASPYSRYPNGAPANMHPYRRPSPGRTQTDSPSGPYHRVVSSAMSVDGGGGGGKPVFATPFNQYESNGMLAPDASTAMEKQLSQMSATSNDGETPTWQTTTRWHRPSFPFPAPPGSNFYEAPTTEMPAPGHPQQAYA